MAKEYIERKAVYQYLDNEVEWRTNQDRLFALEAVSDFPTADVAPVRHGKWESEENIFDDNTWICSVCHEPWVLIDGTPKDNYMHYCPNCGAKMDLEG